MNNKTTFKKDHTYIRNVLRQIDQLMKRNTAESWREIEECYCELSAVCAQMESMARENNIALSAKQ